MHPAGWFEAMISNNNLNFSVVYTGQSGYFDIIREKFERREGVLFYWWVAASHGIACTCRAVLSAHTVFELTTL